MGIFRLPPFVFKDCPEPGFKDWASGSDSRSFIENLVTLSTSLPVGPFFYVYIYLGRSAGIVWPTPGVICRERIFTAVYAVSGWDLSLFLMLRKFTCFAVDWPSWLDVRLVFIVRGLLCVVASTVYFLVRRDLMFWTPMIRFLLSRPPP